MKTLFDPDLTFKEAKELIKSGADVNDVDGFNETPLFFVESVDIAKLLIENGANVNHKNDYQYTPIFFKDNIAIYQVFINAGADINVRDLFGLTALDRQKSMSYASVLISYGALAGRIENYKKFRDLYTKEQREAFDTFMTITTNDNDFFAMCKAYQDNINVKIDIQEIDII